MYRKTVLQVLKHSLYLGLLLLFYVIQTDPYLFSIFGMKPLLIFPTVVIIAMQEGELTGAWYGALAGILLDLSASKLFGFNALLMTLICVVAGLLIIYWIHFSMTNSLLLIGGSLLIRDILCHYFYYRMWGYPESWRIFWGDMLPELLLTLVVSPVIYWLLTHMKEKFDQSIGSC